MSSRTMRSDQRSPTTSSACAIGQYWLYVFTTRIGKQARGTWMVSSDRTKWLALALLCAVQFMVVLDIAIVNVALPSIQTDLGFSQQNLQWVISAYALAFGGFLLLGGRTADLLGRRRILMAGLVLFALASLAGGLFQNAGQLVGARAVQ